MQLQRNKAATRLLPLSDELRKSKIIAFCHVALTIAVVMRFHVREVDL